jgi:peptidoglycan/xylan/chitin deacetylase (PgdA/CDA1 family)
VIWYFSKCHFHLGQIAGQAKVFRHTEGLMKRTALGIMHACGVFSMARIMSSGSPRILMYHNFSREAEADPHNVTVSALRIQLQYLKRHFRVLPLSDLIKQRRSGKSFQSNTVILTIDDGRRNCYEYFYPLLREFQLPATFFVVSSFIDGADWLWTDKVLWLSKQPGAPEELGHRRIGEFFGRMNTLAPQLRDQAVLAIAKAIGCTIPTQPPPPYNPCSWPELREMSDSGLVELGGHTVTHPILSTIEDEDAWYELTASRIRIEQALGRNVRFFCFPNGKPGDYKPMHLLQLKKAGYEAAVSSRFGLVQNTSNPYELPRIGIGGECDQLSFAKNLDGAEHYQMRIQGYLGSPTGTY